MSTVSSVQLYKFLAKYFNLDELRELCLYIDVPFEDLQGGSRDAKALALVQRSERHGFYQRLVEQVQNLRPSTPIAGETPT